MLVFRAILRPTQTHWPRPAIYRVASATRNTWDDESVVTPHHGQLWAVLECEPQSWQGGALSSPLRPGTRRPSEWSSEPSTAPTLPWIVVLLSIEYVSYIVPNSFTTIFFLKSHPDVKCKMTFLYLTLLPSLETGYNYNADKQKILCHLGQARLRFLLQLG